MRHIYLKSFIAFFTLCFICLGQEYSKQKITVRLLPAGINSEYNDYAPCLTPDGKIFYFSSDRKENSLGKADIYYSEVIDGLPGKGINAGNSLNTDDYEGAVSITADGKTIVFAANGRSDGEGNEDIYIGEISDGKILNVKNLGPKVNSKYWDSQPSISGDGKTIYFTSNRKGGSGKEDIWFTKKNADGSWSEAQNIGSVINTNRNERSPFINPDGTLLCFSSDGLGGEGGKDMFICKFENGSWSKPVNPGQPINSKWDESFLFTSPNSKEFYFVSDRNGGLGKLDIYAGTPNILLSLKFKLTITLVDSSTGKPIPGSIEIIDIKKISSVLKNEMNNTPFYTDALDFDKPYKINAESKGYNSKSVEIIAGIDDPEKNIIIKLGQIKVKPIEKPIQKPVGQLKLIISYVDSLSGLPLSSVITITDLLTNEKYVINTNEKDLVYSLMLPSDRKYKIDGQLTDQAAIRTEEIQAPSGNSERKVKFYFSPLILREFNFTEKNYKVPFFVSGYYRPNTIANLDGLYPLLEGALKKATYIERFEKKSLRYNTYKAYAEVVDNIFATVFDYAVDTCFPYFNNTPKSEVLEIVVIGYVDPRPTSGVYYENTKITFQDFHDQKFDVKKGDKIDNFILSGLRAWYSGQLLENLFMAAASKGKPEYNALSKADKIKYKYVAGFISREGFDLESLRNIRILFTRAKK